ncbi:MAG: tRNA (adenosine(37)-N6)-threonylcarbamoyltransferase complex dimerization subunit type 1 TsaB, partial [Cyanobacteriota bacterium]
MNFDIATDKMYLVVDKNNEIVALEHELSTPEKYNSALLIPKLLEVFQKNNLQPSDIDVLAINSGPGSFTGIRAGAVIARTIGQFLDIPVIGLPSLEIYANACNTNKDKFVILDARRSKWYTALYSADNIEIKPPALETNTEVIEYINTLDVQIITES